MTKSNVRAVRRKQAHRKAPILVIVVGALLLLLTAFLAFRRTPAAPSAAIEVTGVPAIRVDKQNVDLGALKLGSNAKVDFTVTNVGDRPLRFTEAPYIEVKEGC